MDVQVDAMKVVAALKAKLAEALLQQSILEVALADRDAQIAQMKEEK